MLILNLIVAVCLVGTAKRKRSRSESFTKVMIFSVFGFEGTNVIPSHDVMGFFVSQKWKRNYGRRNL